MYFKSSFIEPNKFYINSILETFEKILENSLCRGGGGYNGMIPYRIPTRKIAVQACDANFFTL